MIDRATVLQIFGSLIKHPQFLSETDKYNIVLNDFETRLDKFIFAAIDNLYRNGADHIQPIDVENFLSLNDNGRILFKQNNGIDFLQDAMDLSQEENFPYYYKKFKKFNLLRSLKEQGIDIKEFYIEDATDLKAAEVNSKFEQLEIEDIIEAIKRRVLHIERDFINNDATEVQNVFEGIEDLLEDAAEGNDIGYPVQGDLFNEVIAGARKGTFVIRSGGSGVSKTRQAVGDACYLAFPIRFNEEQNKWVQEGSGKRTLFIATEQSIKEIQKMVLAYLTGFNETRFRYGEFTDTERKRIQQALTVMETYKDNLFIVRMPNPTIQLVKNIVRENVLLHDIENVFYDYIFISPSLLNEFKGFNLRNDKFLSYI